MNQGAATRSPALQAAAEINARLVELRSQYKDAGQKAIEEVMERVLPGVPGLNRVIIRGWTPHFNDGDPCEHSQDVALDYQSFLEFTYGEDEEDMLNDLEIPFTTKTTTHQVPKSTYRDAYSYDSNAYAPDLTAPGAAPLNPNLSDDDAKCIRSVFDELGSAFETLHGTNWELTIVIKDGKADVSHDEYNPEY